MHWPSVTAVMICSGRSWRTRHVRGHRRTAEETWPSWYGVSRQKRGLVAIAPSHSESTICRSSSPASASRPRWSSVTTASRPSAPCLAPCSASRASALVLARRSFKTPQRSASSAMRFRAASMRPCCPCANARSTHSTRAEESAALSSGYSGSTNRGYWTSSAHRPLQKSSILAKYRRAAAFVTSAHGRRCTQSATPTKRQNARQTSSGGSRGEAIWPQTAPTVSESPPMYISRVSQSQVVLAPQQHHRAMRTELSPR
mmetsp:Transcript_92063/g.274755  ORF Transcript_92063/g.274755 Transcript_92063/m.274755 type:complete len:258 (+) Transcript_92063:203-976(+)